MPRKKFLAETDYDTLLRRFNGALLHLDSYGRKSYSIYASDAEVKNGKGGYISTSRDDHRLIQGSLIAAASYANQFIENESRDIRILDLGCGHGLSLAGISSSRFKKIGVDFRPEYRRTFVALNPENKTEFHELDLTKLTQKWLKKINPDIVYMYQPLCMPEDMKELEYKVAKATKAVAVGWNPKPYDGRWYSVDLEKSKTFQGYCAYSNLKKPKP